MNIVTNIQEWQSIRKQLRSTPEKTIGFVPTMGNLHAGHMSLCQRAILNNDITVVSIFVNPTQFDQPEDLAHYPRTIDQDIELLNLQPIDYLLMPEAQALYPDNYQIQITESDLSLLLEGDYRPGHFVGMLTIVLKLLNLVQPSYAYFGEKDYQQLLLVRKMVAALFLPTEIIACPTIRANDGLALSSRNSRLNDENRKKAAAFAQLLCSAQTIEEIAPQLKLLGFQIDYIVEKWGRRLGAVWLNQVRLIDNVPQS